MTVIEFLSLIKSRGATIFPVSQKVNLTIVNTNLQNMRAAMLQPFIIDLYNNCSGITMGSACIFCASEIQRGIKYPLPSIEKVNHDMMGNKNLVGKTIFGRNDLFWFAFDVNGTCFMLDNLTLSPLRKYDDPYRAIIDCLIVGKI